MSTCTKTPRKALDSCFQYQGLFALVALLVAGSVLCFPGAIARAQGPAPETPGDAETAATETPDDQQGAETDPPILLEEVPESRGNDKRRVGYAAAPRQFPSDP